MYKTEKSGIMRPATAIAWKHWYCETGSTAL